MSHIFSGIQRNRGRQKKTSGEEGGWVKMVGGWGGYHQKLGCAITSGFQVFLSALNRLFLIQSCWKDGSCSSQCAGSSAGGWNVGPGVHSAGGAGSGAGPLEAAAAGVIKSTISLLLLNKDCHCMSFSALLDSH
ncbi:hypothetical protein CRENBAI_001291 [Crenichthys baileyi]|uniref:Uncharacterized protein n=1 Tax=Crenichthys baileyi TaxID=28760 RepID=A0AAV9RNY1_9TELE